MHYKAVAGLGCALLAFAPSPALAEDPYYFHKSGVARDAYMDDVNDCAELAGGVRTAHYNVYAANPSAAYSAISVGISSFFAGMAEARERRRLVSRVERTCMADKGYERRSLDKDSYRGIRELMGDERIERMFLLVSSEDPIGKVLVE